MTKSQPITTMGENLKLNTKKWTFTAPEILVVLFTGTTKKREQHPEGVALFACPV